MHCLPSELSVFHRCINFARKSFFLCEFIVSVAGGRWLHVSPHVLAPTVQFSFISPSLMNQPDTCFCSQPLDQSLFALFSLDYTRLLLSALGLWPSLTSQFKLLILSLQLFPLNPSIHFLSTAAHFPVSLVAGLSFLFPYPVFLLYLLSSWDTARKICWFVYVPALAWQVMLCAC